MIGIYAKARHENVWRLLDIFSFAASYPWWRLLRDFAEEAGLDMRDYEQTWMLRRFQN